MMNDALKQMKSRHTNIQYTLTGFARRAFLLLALLLCVTCTVKGQVTLIGSGVIDRYHEGDYSTIKANFPKDASSFIPDFSSWGGIGEDYLNQGQH